MSQGNLHAQGVCDDWGPFYEDRQKLMEYANNASRCVNNTSIKLVICFEEVHDAIVHSISELNQLGSTYDNQLKGMYADWPSYCTKKLSPPISFIKANERPVKN